MRTRVRAGGIAGVRGTIFSRFARVALGRFVHFRVAVTSTSYSRKCRSETGKLTVGEEITGK